MDYYKIDRDRIIKKLGGGGSINPRTDDGDVIRQMIRDKYLTSPASGDLGSGQDAGSIKLTKAGRDLYATLTQTNESKRRFSKKLRLSELKKIITTEVRRSLHESVELPRIGSIVIIRGVEHRVVEFTPMLGDHARRRNGYAWITVEDGTEAIVYRDGRIEVM